MMKALAGIGIASISFVALVLLTIMAGYFSLPDVKVLKGCVTTELYKVNLCEKSPDYTPLDRISPYVIGAIIMSEDASFYSHEGIDVEEIKESAIKNFNEGRFARGGSTITQQLAKNVFLSNEKTLWRKVEEIYLAFQLEKHFTKSKILTMYLNVVEFGPGIFGVKQASQYYFRKLPNDLLPEQGAFLAFLLPSPKRYHQSFEKKELTPFAQSSIQRILHKMKLANRISEDEYKAAVERTHHFAWSEQELKPMNPNDVLDEMENNPDDQDSIQKNTDTDFKSELNREDEIIPAPETVVEEPKDQ